MAHERGPGAMDGGGPHGTEAHIPLILRALTHRVCACVRACVCVAGRARFRRLSYDRPMRASARPERRDERMLLPHFLHGLCRQAC